MNQTTIAQQLPGLLRIKYGAPAEMGWSPRLRARFGYCSPDDWYEAAVFSLVDSSTTWLDVGCGRGVFPFNPAGAAVLARRCHLLAGIDPSDNIDDNPILHERAKCTLEDYRSSRRFDLVTLRMVAEHITDPEAAVAALARLTRPGGRVLIYTVEKWSPVTVVSSLTPLSVHHKLKRTLWNTEERDTFPTAYLMNTRRALRKLFEGVGFREESFRHLDDCRSLSRWWLTQAIELLAWKALNAVGLRYPEACILASYRKTVDDMPGVARATAP